ncbi:hypothetical protein C0V72_07540 [Porphyrobacter sp. TH134]|uniref:PepSY-associated TM helix domain-containing protein n=1 Tax=Porphyrobacter sp. TH134 TaxID=2067450 RepID=UPI000C7CBF66|nr:PepSY-associated TM helix domain-containing protein [Porphyrobacter sp. TH134]PLK23898.1 hypothetical protein C0V72_07540 [Porphyrobacter sp. TH134]
MPGNRILGASEQRAARSTVPAASPRRRGSARQFWSKQLHAWHWISAAISLTGMLVFSVTGLTLNHAASIGAEPQVSAMTKQLSPAGQAALARGQESGLAHLPSPVAAELEAATGITAGQGEAEWSADEVYIAVPGPGRDAWASIDRASGRIEAEVTDRGAVSFLNDLHKGRNTGTAWFWFIDLLAVASIIFTITGLLLLQLHARKRPSTWPLVGLGTALPVIVILFFLHV